MAFLPRGRERAYSGSGAAAHGCWPAGVLVGMDRNARVAQQALRKPVVRGLRLPRWLRISSTVDGPRPGYGNRRKPSSGGQRF